MRAGPRRSRRIPARCRRRGGPRRASRSSPIVSTAITRASRNSRGVWPVASRLQPWTPHHSMLCLVRFCSAIAECGEINSGAILIATGRIRGSFAGNSRYSFWCERIPSYLMVFKFRKYQQNVPCPLHRGPQNGFGAVFSPFLEGEKYRSEPGGLHRFKRGEGSFPRSQNLQKSIAAEWPNAMKRARPCMYPHISAYSSIRTPVDDGENICDSCRILELRNNKRLYYMPGEGHKTII